MEASSAQSESLHLLITSRQLSTADVRAFLRWITGAQSGLRPPFERETPQVTSFPAWYRCRNRWSTPFLRLTLHSHLVPRPPVDALQATDDWQCWERNATRWSKASGTSIPKKDELVFNDQKLDLQWIYPNVDGQKRCLPAGITTCVIHRMISPHHWKTRSPNQLSQWRIFPHGGSKKTGYNM